MDRSVQSGFCGQTENLKISKVMLHHYEEPIISGNISDKGSGAIFFTGCNFPSFYPDPPRTSNSAWQNVPYP